MTAELFLKVLVAFIAIGAIIWALVSASGRKYTNPGRSNYVASRRRTMEGHLHVFHNNSYGYETGRGTYSERRLVSTLIRAGIQEKAIFHDLYIKKYNDRFTQIDLVVPTRVGILVFEVKDYSGWIFGDGRHRQWTQVLAYGRQRYRFYNPILQNNKHVSDLRNSLGHFGNIPFYSIIVFYGDCELRDISFVPNGTFITTHRRVTEVVNMILNNNEDVCYSDKWKIIRILNGYVANGESAAIQKQHVENIKDMLGKERVFD